MLWVLIRDMTSAGIGVSFVVVEVEVGLVGCFGLKDLSTIFELGV